MKPVLASAIPALWTAWIVIWLVTARSVKRERWREPLRLRLLHTVPFLLCALLLAGPGACFGPLSLRFAPVGATLPEIGTAMVAAGLAFACWARFHLGRNWSGIVVVKEGHTLVRSGPYRCVRHPIYSGMLLAIAGTALAVGEWRGLLAFAFALVAVLIRVNAEEALMRREFPEYEAYRRGTAALVPLLF
ncbi:MAG TPA: isoprenylcysteine carboxylmethyltransferase family protein [Stellaceae bacterium]|nr:isoprenylcysteine carboxylmethyltransferase family protein [Stellaceae bacterium]